MSDFSCSFNPWENFSKVFYLAAICFSTLENCKCTARQSPVNRFNTSEIIGENMLLENKNCHIEVKIDETYTVDSADNCYYDVTLNPGHFRHNNLSKTLSIHVDLFSGEFRIALIGSFYTYDSDCAVLDENTLTVLQGCMITQINVFDGSIIHYIQMDCFECNFAIYKVLQGYIIYGEIEITMLSFEFVKKWSFSGKDIFVSISGKNPFELHEDSISLYDFEDNHYVIDFEGNLIIISMTEKYFNLMSRESNEINTSLTE